MVVIMHVLIDLLLIIVIMHVLYRSQCHVLLDLSFYDDKTLSLLLQEANKASRPSLVLLPVAILEPDVTDAFATYSQSVVLDDVW